MRVTFKRYIRVEKKLWRDMGGASGVVQRYWNNTLADDMRRELKHKKPHSLNVFCFAGKCYRN